MHTSGVVVADRVSETESMRFIALSFYHGRMVRKSVCCGIGEKSQSKDGRVLVVLVTSVRSTLMDYEHVERSTHGNFPGSGRTLVTTDKYTLICARQGNEIMGSYQLQIGWGLWFMLYSM
jgi:hypothetical protein